MRRRKAARQIQALMISFGTVLLGLSLNFICNDNSYLPNVSKWVAVAEATPTLPTDSREIAATQTTAGMSPPLTAMPFDLPKGFQPVWQDTPLDHGAIQLKALRQGFSLQQTQQQLGSEYFDYGAFLFEQVGKQLPHKRLQNRLADLSLQAQNLGYTLRQAGSVWYDGPPSSRMPQLQASRDILYNLSQLHNTRIIQAQYNQQGQMIHIWQPTGTLTPGPALQTFLGNYRHILNDPLGKQYPETWRMLRQQGKLLQALAEHTALRWESTQYCQYGHCDTLATRFRLQTVQTLPASAIPVELL